MHHLIYHAPSCVIEWLLPILHFLCPPVWPDPAHTPRGEGTGGAPHRRGDVKRESGSAIIPAAAAACPGGIPDPGRPNSRGH